MTKLNGNTRKVLKIIVKNSKNNSDFSRFNLYKCCNISKTEIDLILQYLSSNKYFIYAGMNYCFRLTEKGLHYFSDETYENIELCIKSIFFPVIVAFITTQITLWSKGLL